MAKQHAPDQAIRNFLQKKGANEFWINSAMGYLRRALNGNVHTVTRLSNMRATVSKIGKVYAFGCD